MEPTQLIENFKTQQSQIFEEIKTMEAELLKKKELYVKLQGAIEGVEILHPQKQDDVEVTEESTEN
jgi:hypothetical protein